MWPDRRMRKRLPALAGALFLALALAGCSGRDDSLEITGSSTMAPLFSEFARRYEEQTGTRVDIQSGGTGRGINDVASGMAQLGMASRRLHPDERENGLAETLVARDAIVLVVHRDNPVSTLSRERLVNIFRGDSGHWPEAEWPGAGRSITVVNKSSGRATLETFTCPA